MADISKKKDDVKIKIRSLLLSAPVGLTLQELERDYCQYIGDKLPCREFGYSSTEEFLRDIPDTVQINRRNNVVVLTGVCDSSTQHIQKLVANQKVDSRKNWGALALKTSQRNRIGRKENSCFVDSWNRGNSSEHRDRRFFTSHPSLGMIQEHNQFDGSGLPLCPKIYHKIKEILEIHADGIPLTHFCTIFRRRFGFTLDPRKSGYENICNLLASLSDIVILKQLSAGETWVMSVTCANAAEKCQNFHNPDRLNIPGMQGNIQINKLQTPPTTPTWNGHTMEVADRSIAFHDSQDCSSQPEKTCKIDLFVQHHIRNIMAERPHGLYASRLPFEYKKMFNKELPLKMYGYKNVVEFASDLPHIIHVERPDPYGDWHFLPVGVQTSTGLSSEDTSKHVDAGCKVSKIQVDEDIKEAITQVLSVASDDVPLGRLESVYKELTGENLDFLKSGANSLRQFLQSMSDVFMLSQDAAGRSIVCLKVSDRPRRFDKLKDQYRPTLAPSAQIGGSLLHLPSDAVGPGCYYQQQYLPNFGKEPKYVELYVSNVISPDIFWIQLRGRQTTLALEDLMDDVEAVYKSADLLNIYHMTPYLAQRGQLCAAIFPEDGHWYRAIITELKNQLFQVFYVDYGNMCYVSITQLRLLKTKFLKLPAQALQARLSNIKPADEVWRINSRDRFLALSRERPLVGLVTDVKDNVVSLCLTDTSQAEDVHINDLFVVEGYAIFIPDTSLVEVVRHSQAPSMELLYGENRSVGCQDDVTSVTSSSTTCRRYVRQVHMSGDTTMCVINLDGQLYATSSEISHLFFDEDILSAQLSKDNVDFPKIVVTKREHSELFKELAAYGSLGVSNFTSVLSLFQLSDLPEIIDMYGQHRGLEDVTVMAREVLQWTDSHDSYWKGEEDTSVSESVGDVETRSSASDSLDQPSINQLQLVLCSLEAQRKTTLDRMMRENRWTHRNVDELNCVELQVKSLTAAIEKLQNSKEQLKEHRLTMNGLQDVTCSNQEQSNTCEPHHQSVASPVKSTQRVVPIMQVSPTKQKMLFRTADESCQTGPDVGALLQEQVLINRILMSHLGLPQQSLAGQQQNPSGLNESIQQQNPSGLNESIQQQQILQAHLQQQQQHNRNKLENISNPLLLSPGAYHSSSLQQNQWPLQATQLMQTPTQLQQINQFQQLNQQQQLCQLQQLRQLQQLSQLQQVNDFNSRLSLLRIGPKPAAHLPSNQFLAHGLVNPSSVGLTEQQTKLLSNMNSVNSNWRGVEALNAPSPLARHSGSNYDWPPSK